MTVIKILNKLLKNTINKNYTIFITVNYLLSTNPINYFHECDTVQVENM